MAREKQKRSPYGITGVILGVLALGAALAHFWLGPLDPPPPLENVVAEKAIKIKKAVEAKLKGETVAAPPIARDWDRDRIATAGTIGVAFLAVVLAVISFIRREELRVSGSAAVLGAGAIAFEFLALALAVIVVAILIAAVLSVLGISP